MSMMTITIERIPRTLRIDERIDTVDRHIPRTLGIDGTTIEVEELGVRLPFARKPANLNKMEGYGQTKIYIAETKELTPAEFDAFANSLLVSRDWLDGKGGGVGDGFLCIEVTAPGRPYLYVNPEGSDYARYVARLG